MKTGFLKKDYTNPGLFFSKIRTARSQNCTLILFKLKHSSFKKKKIKGTGFSGRPFEFHFVLNIAKNSYLKPVF